MASSRSWMQQIKHDIEEILNSQEPHRRFIGKYRLQEIWKTVSQNHDPAGLTPGPDSIKNVRGLIDDQDDHRLLILASILICIDWNEWPTFSNTFRDASGRARFQLPLDQRTAKQILGSKALNFTQFQDMFLPKTIQEGKNLEFTPWDCLPFEEKDCPTSSGSSGTVKKIVIERGYFQDADGNIYQQQRTLARKRFHYPEAYEQEIKFLNQIRQSLRMHSSILAHMSTMKIGTDDFSILSAFADGGDLKHFLSSSNINHKSARDRIIKETANIADALHWLHKQIRIDGKHHPCYHLDLKPDNVLIFSRRDSSLESKDEVGTWKLADFGLSVLHECTAEGTSKTFPRRQPGTYQPPEIDDIFGSPNVSARGDIWSFGGIMSMVLAFLVNGKSAVEFLVYQRGWNAAGMQDRDYYYVVQRRDHGHQAILKPQIHDWLVEIGKSSPDQWIRRHMVQLIRECLDVNEHDRPEAEAISTRLNGFLKGKGPEQPEPVSPAFALPPSEDKSKSLWQKLRHKRSESDPQQQKNDRERPPERPTTMQMPYRRTGDQGPSTPTTPAPLSRSAQSPLSTGSARSFKYSPEPVQILGNYSNANLVSIEPSGQHIVICFPTGASVFDMSQGSHRAIKSYVLRHTLPGSFDCIRMAGHYLILYEKNTSNPIFRNLDANKEDPAFIRLADNAERFSRAAKTAISTKGDAVLMHRRVLRDSKHISSEYRMPTHHGMAHEGFTTISFDRTGSWLWACGTKHWFLWKVDSDSPQWLRQTSATNTLAVAQDWKTCPQSLVIFNDRKGFCAYESGPPPALRLVDASQTSKVPIHLETPLQCAVIGFRDDQIFYVRLLKSRRLAGLYRRSIQGNNFGSEVLISELSDMDYRAKFDIAAREEDHAQLIIIVSSEGKYQCHRLDFEAHSWS